MPTGGPGTGGATFQQTAAIIRGWGHRERLRPYRVRGWTATHGLFPIVPPPGGPSIAIYRGRGQDLFSVCFPFSYGLSCSTDWAGESFGFYREAARPHRLRPALVVKSSECHGSGAALVDGPPCTDKALHPVFTPGQFGVERIPNRPPRLRAWFLMTPGSTPVPGIGTYSLEQNAICSKDMINAARCLYALLYPITPDVPPATLAGWGMPADARNHWIGNVVHTYQVPCYKRATPPPWPFNPNLRYVSDTDDTTIDPGLRALVAQSGGNANPAWLAAYHTLNSGVDDTLPFVENLWRHYPGQSAATRRTWTADPQQRGWWIEFQAEFDFWFVCNTFWSYYAPFPAPGGPTMLRWNFWYEGRVRTRTNGNPADAAFRAWVESYGCGWGVKFRPRTFHACDPLVNCANIRQAMGDTVLPAAAFQDLVQQSGVYDPPCLREGLGYSHWYSRDHANCPWPTGCVVHQGVSGPFTPYCPLPHVVRRELLNPDGSSAEVLDGYSFLTMSDLTPALFAAT